MIYIIDDDLEFAEVVKGILVRLMARAGEQNMMSGDESKSESFQSKAHEVRLFTNVIQAINAMSDEVPDLIFLDVLLDGPDGFTLLNEMQSYPDLAEIPVVLMTSLKLDGGSLRQYGVVEILNKSKMMPEQLSEILAKYGGGKRIVDKEVEIDG